MTVFCGETGMVYLWQGGFVFIGISWLVYLFVSRIAQNLLSQFFFTKFSGKVALVLRKKRLGMLRNLDLDPDTGIF